ncbi:hypothetical protein M427DRAFT_376907 [Gonapodya prolifera JEL478]|uniref:Xylanolytic transcriptional activator regulatory domain-containing protein n=1 Tax=Gonapodya prolifera (strain JEL478) TaxID=1344416 RepID=A0A139AUW1_GONPJ|nr:hypothetical protein M427DRAFT_376907 [Gonapodya prolifera JEL478]|eukprot:KXS20508.1 hypothetical protein M427DRAFT_376907 [Gonapodya prolifera JEL478]
MPDEGTCNALVLLYFVKLPPLINVIHPATVATKSYMEPVIFLSILTATANFHESPLIRKMADAVFYPRLHRLIKAEIERPSLDATIGFAHAFLHVVGRAMWNIGYFYLTMMCGNIRLLGLSDETTIERRFHTWSEREIARRVFWTVYQMDRSSSAASMQMQQLSDDLCSLLKLQCPDDEWISRDTPMFPSSAPTLEEFFTDPKELPLKPSSNGAVPPQFPNLVPPSPTGSERTSPLSTASLQTALAHLFGRTIDLRLSCARRNILVFAPTGRASVTISKKVVEIERDLSIWGERLNEFMTSVGVKAGTVGLGFGSLQLDALQWNVETLTEVDLLYLRAEWHIVFTLLHSPSAATMRLANQMVSRSGIKGSLEGGFTPPATGCIPKSFAPLAVGSSARGNEWAAAPRMPTRGIPPFQMPPDEGQIEDILFTWTQSPSFISALSNACKASDLIEMMGNLDPNFTYGTAVTWSFSPALFCYSQRSS